MNNIWNTTSPYGDDTNHTCYLHCNRYLISGNIWVISIHIVPKKDIIVVIKNEKNEIVPITWLLYGGWVMIIDIWIWILERTTFIYHSRIICLKYCQLKPYNVFLTNIQGIIKFCRSRWPRKDNSNMLAPHFAWRALMGLILWLKDSKHSS